MFLRAFKVSEKWHYVVVVIVKNRTVCRKPARNIKRLRRHLCPVHWNRKRRNLAPGDSKLGRLQNIPSKVTAGSFFQNVRCVRMWSAILDSIFCVRRTMDARIGNWPSRTCVDNGKQSATYYLNACGKTHMTFVCFLPLWKSCIIYVENSDL